MNTKQIIPTLFLWATALVSTEAYAQTTLTATPTQNDSQEKVYKPTTLKYSLISRPDLETTLNEQNAAKVRKLANYMISNDSTVVSSPSIQDVLESKKTDVVKDYQYVNAKFVLNGMKYSVSLTNIDESKNSTDPDYLSIFMTPVGKPDQGNLVMLIDDGLDGNCNSGLISASLNTTGKTLTYQAKTSELGAKNVENRQRFQMLYLKTLDDLIAYYSKK